jgi:hypothetical protein
MTGVGGGARRPGACAADRQGRVKSGPGGSGWVREGVGQCGTGR